MNQQFVKRAVAGLMVALTFSVISTAFAQGQRRGISGDWNLSTQFGERTMESNQGARHQRLRIHPDLSGLYGTLPVDRVELDGDQLRFTATTSFGDREFTWNFQGKIDGDSLTGEVSTGQGSRQVTGSKVTRSLRVRNTR